VVTCEIKQKQNTETILKRFRIVSELFQAHYHIYSHVEKYANPKTVSAVLANHKRPHTPPTMTSLMTLCNITTTITTVNMANKFSDDQIDILINMWQSEPALWNSNLLIYSNADARKAALARISSQLNIDTGMYKQNFRPLGCQIVIFI